MKSVASRIKSVEATRVGVKSQWSLWSPTLQYPLQPTTAQRNMAVTNDSCKWDACHWKSTCATPTPFQIKHPRKHGGCRGWNHIFGTFLCVFNMKWGWDYPFMSIIVFWLWLIMVEYEFCPTNVHWYPQYLVTITIFMLDKIVNLIYTRWCPILS